MNIKFSLILFLSIIVLHGCKVPVVTDQYEAKDIYGTSIGHLANNYRYSRKMIYYTENKTKLKARDKSVEFIWGQDSLSKYIINKYYQHPMCVEDQFNTHVLFCILFDKNLSIKEIRIYQLNKIYDNFKYYEIIKEVIKGTDGMWYKTTKKKSNWYVYHYHGRFY